MGACPSPPVPDRAHSRPLEGVAAARGDRVTPPGIPAAPRLLAAADAYQSLTSDRPYRPARPPEAAAELLRAEARAGRLDPEGVGVVLAAAGQGPAGRGRAQWPAGLTDREVEVLRLLARGLSRKEVAATLFISEKTAGHHAESIYRKLGVSSRAAAALFAAQHDLV